MKSFVTSYSRAAASFENTFDGTLPLMARFVFAAVLFQYFWNSGLTKLGEGLFGIFQPSFGAYAQIFPKAVEAAGYDPSQLSFFHWAVVFSGTVAEFLLPVLIVIGLATRLAALGMVGFVIVQSLTDLYGHNAITHTETVGAWFDRFPHHTILDQRAFWMLLLAVLIVKGAGILSADHVIQHQISKQNSG